MRKTTTMQYQAKSFIRARTASSILAIALLQLVVSAGCHSTQSINEATAQLDAFGRTYYIDGAGNWGCGVKEVRQALKEAGYKGRIINYTWSPTLNPVLDQTIGRPVARRKGKKPGEQITRYLTEYPNTDVNIIALSAGTGVATWACEHIGPNVQVTNVIMLGSSLSSSYDMSKALKNIKGDVYVYYSQHDAILSGAVRLLGTIDGELGANSAGLVGLHPAHCRADNIHNISWSQRYEQYGWCGGHIDSTSEAFILSVVSLHIVPKTAMVELASMGSSWTQ